MQDYKTHNWPEDAEYYAYLTRYEQNMTYLTQAADYLNKPDPVSRTFKRTVEQVLSQHLLLQDYEYPTPPPTPDLSPVKSSSRSLALRRTESANSGDEVKVKAEARASLAQASSDNPLKRGHGALDDSREPPEIEALKRSISLAGGNATNGGQHANDDPLEAFRRAAGDAFDPSGMANLPRVPSAPPAESPSSSIYPSPAIGYSPMADYAKLGGAMSPSSNPLPKPRQTAAAIAAALQAATAKAPSPGAKPGTLNSPSSSAAPTPIQPIAIPNLAAMQSSANSPIPAAIGTPNLGTVWGRRLSITGGNAAGGLGTPISVGVLGSPQLPGTNTAQALLFSQFQPAGQASPVTAEPQQQQPTAQLFSLDLAGTGAAGLANAPNLANISFTLDAQQRAMLQRQAMQQQFQQQQFQQQQFQQQQLQQQQLQQHQLQQQQLQAAIASSGQQAAAEAAARANAVAASAARASPVQPPAPIANPEKPPEPELNFDDFFGDGEEENGTGDGTWKQGADMSISFGSDPIEPAGAAGNSTAQGLSATDAMAATTRGASQSNLDMTLQGMFNTELFGDDLAMMRGGEDGSLLGLDLIDEDGNKWA